MVKLTADRFASYVADRARMRRNAAGLTESPPSRTQTVEKIVEVERVVEVPADTSALDAEIARLRSELADARSVPVVDYIFTVVRDKNYRVQRVNVAAQEQAPMRGRDGRAVKAYDYEIKVGERDGLGLIKTVTAVAKPALGRLDVGASARRVLN